MIEKIFVEEKIKEIKKAWSPVEIVRVNDYVIRIALFDGEYHWHKHENEDELFYVYKGKIIIQIKNQQDLVLNEGEMALIPKGVKHCPKSVEPSYVLLFEPMTLKSSGT